MSWAGDGTVMWVWCNDCSGVGRAALDDAGAPDPARGPVRLRNLAHCDYSHFRSFAISQPGR